MSTTTKDLTDHEEVCVDEASCRMRAAMRRMQRALAQRDRQAVLVEARCLKDLAKTIEQGLAE